MSGASIRLQNIERSFAGKRVLRNVSLDVPAGAFVSLIGASGVGKSTLLKIVAGLDRQAGGTMTLSAGTDRADVRMMFQEDRLLPWRTVLGNVTLGTNGQDAEAAELLRAVGLGGREQDYPSVLSGGQRQRAALARALLHRPDVLLLDEPFGALDALNRAAMQELLSRLLAQAPRTVLLVTHDVEEALLLSDRVIVMREGRIVRDLTPPGQRPRPRGDAELALLKEELVASLLQDDETASPSLGSSHAHARAS
ncbi:ABC transporter ATP-binding protein [Aureimonas frigidaquae]|uniref:ABC-type nitrate/sulfonate/bicarbonate transport system, ATPase component n=1 Tax=Aureimonas frigidaquae TaxID=424757 RepID=A0A0P0Z3D0_9HYPH|nr:ABC transporter ATP-binding protein [Aureimonas frigidaquae]BAT28610.1 ABC-type nitrate/sulfonate/bicarbonate transport system, ATPase component [Aureimonas frigidaquae]